MARNHGKCMLGLMVALCLGGCSGGQPPLALERSGPSPENGQASPAEQPARNSYLAQSAWPVPHRNSARQASSPLRGPDRDASVTLHRFKTDAGRELNASPFTVVSGKQYPGTSDRTLWGASLNNVYKYVLRDDGMVYADSIQTWDDQTQISWNLFALAHRDWVVAPMPRGLPAELTNRPGCFANGPAIVAFSDGATPNSPIECAEVFEYTSDRLEAACGFRRPVPFVAGNLTAVLHNGEIATVMERSPLPGMLGLASQRGRESFLLVLADDLSEIRSCAKIGDGSPTNQFAIEPVGRFENKFYIATTYGLVAMSYDSRSGALTRSGAVDLGLRERTGTTPTLMGFGDDPDKFVFIIDAKCAVGDIRTGEIECDKSNTRPTRLVAVRRDNFTDEGVVSIDLPDYMDTVENSPAAAGYDAVVANYSGYGPYGKKDGSADFAKGILKLSWRPDQQRFMIDWERPDIQINGVPTISTASNAVYSSGAGQADNQTYFYGLRLKGENAGQTFLRTAVGPAIPSNETGYGAFFDQGNNTLIVSDGVAVFPTASGFVRIQ